MYVRAKFQKLAPKLSSSSNDWLFNGEICKESLILGEKLFERNIWRSKTSNFEIYWLSINDVASSKKDLVCVNNNNEDLSNNDHKSSSSEYSSEDSSESGKSSDNSNAIDSICESISGYSNCDKSTLSLVSRNLNVLSFSLECLSKTLQIKQKRSKLKLQKQKETKQVKRAKEKSKKKDIKKRDEIKENFKQQPDVAPVKLKPLLADPSTMEDQTQPIIKMEKQPTVEIKSKYEINQQSVKTCSKLISDKPRKSIIITDQQYCPSWYSRFQKPTKTPFLTDYMRKHRELYNRKTITLKRNTTRANNSNLCVNALDFLDSVQTIHVQKYISG